MTKIYIIAGEASGDFLGARLIEALREHADGELSFYGIGGERMAAQGLTSLFEMHELSLMGFAEVLPHIKRLKLRIRETVADIKDIKPDIIITIDSPGFTFRVIRALKSSNTLFCPAVHYVSPTVWAYKPKRAKKTAALFDHLLTLLPFEPPYFEAEGLPTSFVGHAVAWDWKQKGDGEAFRKKHTITDNSIVLGMMPGSRKNELKRHLPVFEQVARKLKSDHPSLEVVIPIRRAMCDNVKAATAHWPLPVHIIEGDAEKKDAFAACNVALAKSGTVSLETALAGIPTITIFKAHPISIWLARRMVKVSYINLVNIIDDHPVIPELVQEHCTPKLIVQALEGMLSDSSARENQLNHFKGIAQTLGANDALSPSDKAAQLILQEVAAQQN